MRCLAAKVLRQVILLQYLKMYINDVNSLHARYFSTDFVFVCARVRVILLLLSRPISICISTRFGIILVGNQGLRDASRISNVFLD